MSDMKAVLGACKAIEHALETEWHGRGRGLNEKLNTAAYRVPQHIVNRIRYVATLRNKAVHEDGFEIENIDAYLATAQRALQDLKQALPAAIAARRRRLRVQFAVGAGVVLVALVVMWGGGSGPARRQAEPEPVAMPAPQPRTVQSVTVTSTAMVEPAPAAPQSPAVAGGAAPAAAGSPAPVPRAPAAPAAAAGPVPTLSAGTHHGVPNAVVEFEEVAFAVAPDAFDRQQARITVRVRNTSGTTLSHLVLDARLYIDGEATPVADTSRVGGPRDGLYVFFPETGLAAGQSGRFTVGAAAWSLAAFSVPDVLRARERTLILRVAKAADGRKRDIAASSQPWPAVQGRARSQPAPTPASAAAVAVDVPALREAVRAGRSIGYSDGQIGVENIQLSTQAGAFGRTEIVVQAEVVNHTQVTLAHVQLEGWLLAPGAAGARDVIAPATTASGARGSSLFATFGDQGLASGERRTVKLYLDSFATEWRTPDALAALASGRSHVVLRAAEYADGRKVNRRLASPGLRQLL